MTETTIPRLPWQDTFLATLAKTKNVRESCRAAGVSSSAVYSYRSRKAHFTAAWQQALDSKGPGTAGPNGPSRTRFWRTTFFEALAATSNVTAAAARVNMPIRTIYKLRREDPEFAARWLTALHEGYDNLEIELLGYLRDSEPRRKMDVAAALRLLAAHRETVERQRALAGEEDEQAVLDSLDAFFEGLRQRRLANETLLAEPDTGDDED